MRLRLTLLAGAVVAAILVLQWLPLVQAGWSIRDDYDFVSSMNDHGRISFHDFVERLNPFDMELGSVVNRPIYVIVHDLWMLVIGNNLPVWQSAKIFTFSMAMALCIWFFALATDPVAAVFLTFFVGFQSGWADVVPRANAELFGVVGSDDLRDWESAAGPNSEQCPGERRQESLNLLPSVGCFRREYRRCFQGEFLFHRVGYFRGFTSFC